MLVSQDWELGGAVPRQFWQLQKGLLSDGDCSEMDTTFEEVQKDGSSAVFFMTQTAAGA